MSYSPSIVPQNARDLPRFIQEELDKIRDELGQDNYIRISIRNVAPDKPRVGIYAADGTNWNPGGGAGVYYYDGSTYTKL